MNLSNLCSLADAYYVAEDRSELNQKFIDSSEIIYSDGTNSHHIDNDGYIDINNIKDADYIVFLDQNANVFLGIYKYILEPKYKEVIDALNRLRSQTGMHKHNRTPDKEKIYEYHGYDTGPKPVKPVEPKREDDKILKKAPADLVNINDMTCSECGSKDFIQPFRYDKEWNISCQCAKCSTVYKLIPSKYYVIKSITKFKDTSKETINIQLTKEYQESMEENNERKIKN